MAEVQHVSDLATPQDYEVLKRLSVGKKCVFEFGSFVGGSALAMLPQIRDANGCLFCVDHFMGNEDDTATKQVAREPMISTLLLRTAEFKDSLTVIVADTSVLAWLVKPSIADTVFIDASHSYRAVAQDIEIANRLIKSGGIVCGHDYVQHYEDCDPDLVRIYSETPSGCDGGVSYGVIRAVHEAYDRPNHEAAVWWVEVNK